MAQTPEGARQAAETAKKKYGADHHQKIGSIGGKSRTSPANSTFYKDRELAKRAGSKGGKAKKGYRKTQSE